MADSIRIAQASLCDDAPIVGCGDDFSPVLFLSPILRLLARSFHHCLESGRYYVLMMDEALHHLGMSRKSITKRGERVSPARHIYENVMLFCLCNDFSLKTSFGKLWNYIRHVLLLIQSGCTRSFCVYLRANRPQMLAPFFHNRKETTIWFLHPCFLPGLLPIALKTLFRSNLIFSYHTPSVERVVFYGR